MRLKIVAGNWKMNNTLEEAIALLDSTLKLTLNEEENQLNIFAVPYPFLMMAKERIKSYKNFAIAAQNCASYAQGAYTGEVSAAMLSSIGITHCIVGHSERRSIFNEKSDQLNTKLNLLLQHSIIPIWCCGEQLEDRNSNRYFAVILQQMEDEVFKLDVKDFNKLVIAYEPVWAIGTGLTASAFQAQEMHAYIRNEISKRYDHQTAEKVSILYGGSCNAENARELFSLADVDGGLIGGASLKSESFVKLISLMYELH